MIMRQLFFGTVGVIVLASVCGCGGSDSQPFAAPNKLRPSFDVQLQTADTLTNRGERDEFLVVVALDAANVGDAHWAQLALKAINDWEVRDNAALDVAIRLCKGGKKDAAEEVAKSISSSAVRGETLKFITKAK
jgi:hypothetical protein